jgi:hypothetical protein
MGDPDSALAQLKRVRQDFAAFCAGRGTVSEADTRAKLIDKVLTEVCFWPEGSVAREERVDSGLIDYSLVVRGRRFVAVEAKREGVSFALPEPTHKSLKLSGTVLTDRHIAEAITQVRGYCDDAGIRYAVATNGYAWMIFRAIREDMPWRDGHARIFPSLEYIESHFTEFWNLISYDAVVAGSLDGEFGTRLAVPRRLERVLDHLYNADLPLRRNRLHFQLYPLIEAVFENIADQEPPEILKSCYVHTGSLRIVVRDLNTVITDAIPEFLLDQGAQPVHQSADGAGSFGAAVEERIAAEAPPMGHLGQLYLLLGGIGAGKTTFIKRYQREVGKPVLDGGSLWFHLDFLEAPIDPQAIEAFVWQRILEDLRTRYHALNLETRRNIKQVFRPDIEVLEQTVLRQPGLRGEQYQTALSPYLDKWQSNVSNYVPRLLRFAKGDRRLPVIIFIDNVDQLAPIYQAQVFLLAQRVARTVGSITVLSLREESYYTANLQKTLTAYTSRKFHIASPNFRKMIDYRIRFALDMLENSKGPIDYVLRSGITIDRTDIAEFLKIIETSIFQQNRNIARFIEALCFGNMRLALRMFSTFMTSGATDVDKMLTIYRRSEPRSYYVAFHEFVKSIMLNERRYYKDSASPILNVFDCAAERNSSHFSALRILRMLLLRRGESTDEGQGYVDIGVLVSVAEDVFDNREDLIRALNRLVARQLVEVNTKSTDSITGASHVRVTSSGWYYCQFLVRSFSYMDLVLQDTPLNEAGTEKELRLMVQQVDNLSDREEEKLARMEVRFARVRTFLAYLKTEEEEEAKVFNLPRGGGIWAAPFMPDIVGQIDREIEWIARRLKENRELFPEDVTIWADGLDEGELASLGRGGIEDEDTLVDPAEL